MFDRYYQARRRNRDGIGLGLSIAKGIVEAHGGSIRVEDGPGARGSRVVVTLPVGDEEEKVAEEGRELGIVEDERQAAHTGS